MLHIKLNHFLMSSIEHIHICRFPKLYILPIDSLRVLNSGMSSFLYFLFKIFQAFHCTSHSSSWASNSCTDAALTKKSTLCPIKFLDRMCKALKQWKNMYNKRKIFDFFHRHIIILSNYKKGTNLNCF